MQFDQAVCLIGLGLEYASQEMEKLGTEESPRWENKYTMRQLLDPEFRLPLRDGEDMVDIFAAVEGMELDEVR